ncbi:hypothetical protein PLICRDRAFT_198536 [Plicaturopsis crispa FD-325 SS-3]|nr:hypothetical protein PLICRDRAFT_198536 [Plicaturopsis crispa FD-325 SS-3]
MSGYLRDDDERSFPGRFLHNDTYGTARRASIAVAKRHLRPVHAPPLGVKISTAGCFSFVRRFTPLQDLRMTYALSIFPHTPLSQDDVPSNPGTQPSSAIFLFCAQLPRSSGQHPHHIPFCTALASARSDFARTLPLHTQRWPQRVCAALNWAVPAHPYTRRQAARA